MKISKKKKKKKISNTNVKGKSVYYSTHLMFQFLLELFPNRFSIQIV